MQQHFRLAKGAFKLISALTLLAGLIWLVKPERLWQALLGVNVAIFGLALLCGTLSNIMSAARWAHLARAMGLNAPLQPLIGFYFQGMAANAFLPGATVGGDVWRSYRLHRLDNSLLDAGASVFFERLSGLWVLLLLSLLAVPVSLFWQVLPDWLRLGHIAALALYLLALAMLLAVPYVLVHPLLWRWLPLETARNIAERVLASLQRLSRRTLQEQLIYSAAVQLLSMSALYLCARAVGADASWLLLAAAAGPIFLMAALPLGIGGWGTRELAAVAVLGLAGMRGEQALALAVLYGVNATLQAFAGGLAWWMEHLRREQ